MTEELFVLVNPTAGKGKGASSGDAAISKLRALGVSVTAHFSTSKEDARAFAARAVAESADALVVVGGDGTLSAILDDVAHSTVPIGLIPAGTGNDFARAMCIPYGSKEAVGLAAERVIHNLRHDNVVEIDLATAKTLERETKYLTVAAMGFDARVSERTNHLKWPKGSARYYLALIIELVRLRPLQFKIKADETEEALRPGILAAVGNTRSYGGGMPMCTDADPSDGYLDLTHIAPIGRLKLVRLFPLLLKAKHTERAEVLMLRVKQIEIAAPGLIVYADGEKIGTEAVSIRVLPRALRVLYALTS